MRTRRAFHPEVNESLEPRAVPSLATLSVAPAVVGQRIELPARGFDRAGVRTSAAIDDFTRRFSQAVEQILLATGRDGTVDPTASRDRFDATIREAIDALARELVASLEPTSTPAVAEQVREAIVGDTPDSLASQITALVTTAIEQGTVGSTLAADVTQLAERIRNAVVPSENGTRSSHVIQGGSDAVESIGFAHTAPITPTPAPSPEVIEEIRRAFGAFLADYLAAAREEMLAPSHERAAVVSTGRSEREQSVESSLRDLSSRLTDLLRHSGLDASRIESIVESIGGSGRQTLASRLASLPDPSNSPFRVIRDFTLGSFRTVAGFFECIVGDLRPLLAAMGATE